MADLQESDSAFVTPWHLGWICHRFHLEHVRFREPYCIGRQAVHDDVKFGIQSVGRHAKLAPWCSNRYTPYVADRGSGARISTFDRLGKVEGDFSMKAASIQKALGAFNMLVTLFIAAPLVFVVAVAFTQTERLALPPGGQLSLRWFEALIHNQGFVRTFIFSSCLAVSAASISTIIGVLGAFGIVRHKFKYRNLLETLFISPLTIPAAVLGVALLQFFFYWAGLIVWSACWRLTLW